MVACERSAEKASSEWEHQRISPTETKAITTY